MNLSEVYLSTLLTELPTIINFNNDEFKRYLDLFYNESLGIIVVPITTTGRVKGATGEFVNIIVDNLTVKNQYTNLYENSTTADYNWYKMMIDPVFVLRDPCTATDYWPFENIPGYKVIDVNKPYYRIDNEFPVILENNNLSQVVGIFCASTLIGTDPFTILMDPDPDSPTYMTTYTIDISYAGEAYIEFIAIKYDPSWGSTWDFYKYAFEGTGSGGGGGIIGPGTPTYLSMFETATTIGDSSVYMNGDTLVTRDIQIHNAIRDSSDNILIGYGSPMQLNDPASGRDISIYGNVNIIEGTLYTNDVSTIGILNVDGSIFLNGTEVGQTIYNPSLSDDIKMPDAVGGLPADTSVGYLRGKTLEQLFTEILFPTVLASIYTPKSLGYTGLTSAYAEPSALYTPTLTATYVPGVIHNGDDTLGPNVTGDAYYFKFKLPGGTIDFEEAYAGNSRAHLYSTSIYIGNAGDTHTWSVDVSYNAGSGVYYDNKGNVGSNLDAQRVADMISANSGTITSRNKRYWGVNALTSLTSSQVITLDSSEFATGYTKSLFNVSPTNQYIYYCYPASFVGTPVFTVGGLTFTAIHNIGPLSVTNSYGHAEDYNIWRTDTVQNGTNISIVIT